MPQQIFAQVTASQSAHPTTTPTDSVDPFDGEKNALKKEALLESAIKSLTHNLGSSFSMTKRLPAKVRQLSKKTFKSEEKIPVMIENEDAENIKVELFNADGVQMEVAVEEITVSNPTTLTVAPPNHFKPGRYRLKITDSQGIVNTQEFTWGVLAINTNKSIYQPQDTAKIQMAVLDELGNMVCDAKVKLSIKDPTGKVLDLATQTASESSNANTIKVNPECFKKEYTAVPDYETAYAVEGGVGSYEMTLTAETKNGTFTITDSFQTKEDVPFDVERNANTRIYPPVRYPVTMEITANQDFSGEISEVVPEKFNIAFMENTPVFDIATRSAETKTEARKAHLELPFNGNYEITQGFGEDETDPLLAEKYHKYGVVGHDGMDYALPMYTPVLAADDGAVVRAQEKGDYGTTIILQHSWGKSYYGHLSKMEKKQGDIVKKGQVIGLSGNTGLSTGPHLHFGIKLKKNDTDNGYFGKINPRQYFKDSSSLGQVAGISTTGTKILRDDTETGVQILTWNVNVKKGDKLKLGYTYLAPNDSLNSTLSAPSNSSPPL
jgi:murein DD-endopeptidase MepM/ murein hydrolase activator NlpD